MQLRALLLLTALAGAVTETPRLVVTLEAKAGKVSVTVENTTQDVVSIKALTFITLASCGPEDPPRYWAKVEVQNLPAQTRPMLLGPLAKQRVSLDPAGMLWTEDRFTPGQAMVRTVLPGEYRLGIEVRNPGGPTWHSAEVPIAVMSDGTPNF